MIRKQKKTSLKVGDSVQVQNGFRGYDEDIDMSGWQGRIIDLDLDEGVATIEFDSITLRNMPGAYIDDCEEGGYGWAEYGYEFRLLTKVPERDSKRDVKKERERLVSIHAQSHFGEDGREMNRILAGTETEWEEFVRWSEYLKNKLHFPFQAEVVDSVLGRRSPLRYGERVRVIGIEIVDDTYGIIARVKQKNRILHFPMCDLQAIKKRTSNYDVLRLYSLWFSNR